VACSTLQRAAVAGESLEVLAASLAKGLGERVLPAIEALSKKVRSRDMPQVRPHTDHIHCLAVFNKKAVA
jgi:hypothetical protein